MIDYESFCVEFRENLTDWWNTSNIPADLQDLYDPIYPILIGGKFLRPYVYQIFADKNKSDNYSLSLELLHLFALVHDDLIDQSGLRRGHPTLHTALNTNNSAISADLAIIIGDWIFHQSFKSITHTISSPENVNIMAIYNQLAEEVMYGQLYDISFTQRSDVQPSEIKKKNILKTAHYSFTRPMMMGYVSQYGAMDEPTKQWLESAGTTLGLFFQTQDDLLDITSNTVTIGKPAFNDILEGQWTMIRWFLQQECSVDEWNWITSLQTKKLDTSAEKKLEKLINKYQIKEKVLELLSEQKHALEEMIQNAPTAELGAQVLHLFTLIEKRTK